MEAPGFESLAKPISLSGGDRQSLDLTLDRSLPGPDQATSATPDELRELVLAIRDVEAALGDGLKHPSDAELANRDSMRRSLVASQVRTRTPRRPSARTAEIAFRQRASVRSTAGAAGMGAPS